MGPRRKVLSCKDLTPSDILTSGCRVDLEDVFLAPRVLDVEPALVEFDTAVMLDAELPAAGDVVAAEAFVVVDPEVVLPGGAKAEFLAAVGLGLEPVDVLGAEAFAVVDVELAVVAALGVQPVDFLAAWLDDVKVQVDLCVPDQGELGVADLDLDAVDQLAAFAELGQAEAVAEAGARVLGVAAGEPGVGAQKGDVVGLERREF
jgi:hypothetical protein